MPDIRLEVGVPYKTPEGLLTIRAGELRPDGVTNLWVELRREDGSIIREMRSMTRAEIDRIEEENLKGEGE